MTGRALNFKTCCHLSPPCTRGLTSGPQREVRGYPASGCNLVVNPPSTIIEFEAGSDHITKLDVDPSIERVSCTCLSTSSGLSWELTSYASSGEMAKEVREIVSYCLSK